MSGLTAIDKQGLFCSCRKVLRGNKTTVPKNIGGQRKSRNEWNDEPEGPTYEPGAFGL